MGRLAARVDNLDKKRKPAVTIRYNLTCESDPEAFELTVTAGEEDPAFKKRVNQLLAIIEKIGQKLDKQYGKHIPQEEACVVSDDYKEALSDLFDYIEAKIGRPLYIPINPDWDTDLDENGNPKESVDCFPESRADYWRSVKLAQYDTQ